MSKPTINGHLLDTFLAPLGTYDSDEDLARFKDFDIHDEEAARRLIRTDIKPFYESWGSQSKIIGKDSLAYWLSFHHDRLEVIYATAYLPLLPEGTWQEQSAWIDRFFVLIWEELFGPDDYHLADPSAYEVHNDITWGNWVLKR